MKKYFYSVFAAATMLFAVTSCSQEEDFIQSSGEMTTFSISLDGAVGSRATGEGTKATKLYYQAYRDGELVINKSANINKTAKIEMALLKGETYDIIFWAQAANDTIYQIDDLRNITIDYTTATPLANQESYDAFYNSLDDFKSDAKTHTIELRRPFAKLNLGTSDWKIVETDAAENVNETDPVTHTSVVVKGLANTLNTLTGQATGNEKVTFALSDIPEDYFELNGVTYKRLSLNYLLVPNSKAPQGLNDYQAEGEEGKANVDLTFALKRGDKQLFTIDVPNAPVQRNWRTNVVGALLTGSKFDVIIKPDTDDKFNTLEILEEVLAKGGEVTLFSDVTLTENITIPEGVEVKINLNEKTLNFNEESSIIVKGNLEVTNGNVKVAWQDGYAFDVRKGATLNIGSDATIITESNAATAIYMRGGTLNVDGTIKSDEANQSGVFFMPSNSADVANVNINGTINSKYYALVQQSGTSNLVVEKDVTLDKMMLGASGTMNLTYFTANQPTVENDGTAVTLNITGHSVSSIDDLQKAIDDAETPMTFMFDANNATANENKQLSIPRGKDITIIGSENTEGRSASKNSVFKGQLKVSGKLTLKDIIVMTPDAAIANEVSQFSKSAIAVTSEGEVICENVIFEMGNLQNATAITGWWDTGKGTNIVVKNCTFNCAGQRPLRSCSSMTVENCVFNDPYRYAIQLTAKSSTATELENAIVNFNYNTINAGNTTKNPVYGIQLEGEEYGCSNLIINGIGNTINFGNTEKTGSMYYCEGGKIDHSTIVWNTEVKPVHANPVVYMNGKTYVGIAAAITAMNSNEATIELEDVTYDFPIDVNLQGKNITIKGTKASVLDVEKVDERNQFVTGANLAFEGITLKFGIKNYMGFANTASLSYKDCDIYGLQFFSGAGNTTFENCNLQSNGAEHCAWTWGGQNISFTACNFTYGDRAVNCYGEGVTTNISFTDCTFTKVVGKDTTGAIETNSSALTALNLTINNCSVNEGDLWWVSTWDSKNGENTVLIIDGNRVAATTEQLKIAIEAGISEIYVSGEMKMPSSGSSNTIKIIGDGTAVIDNTLGAYLETANLTFEKINFKTTFGMVNGNGADYAALYSKNIYYKECNFEGPILLGRDGAKFEGCTFNNLGNDYVRTYGNDATFEGCTFNTEGKAILIYSDGGNEVSKVSVTGCTFNATQGAKAGAIANQNCAAIEIHNYGNGVNLTTENNTIDSDFSGVWRIKTYESGKPRVFVNGTEYTTIALDGKTMTIDGNKNVTVNE